MSLKSTIKKWTVFYKVYCIFFKIIDLFYIKFIKKIDKNLYKKILKLDNKTKLPSFDNTVCQIPTYNQYKDNIYTYWCNEMNHCPRWSRKTWEFVYILQTLHRHNMIKDNMKGIGFGCGREPLSGVFVKHGCKIVATDLSNENAYQAGWRDTSEHSRSLDEIYIESQNIIEKEIFFNNVEYYNVDMNNIPNDFDNKYDFVWSACALEHLGSLEHGLNFIKKSLKCLKKGGVAVHTTEFNLSSENKTIESKSLSIYRKKDIVSLLEELSKEGYEVSPINLNTGDNLIDNYIDLPPYKSSPHIKLMLEEYVITSIGFYIKKVVD